MSGGERMAAAVGQLAGVVCTSLPPFLARTAAQARAEERAAHDLALMKAFADDPALTSRAAELSSNSTLTLLEAMNRLQLVRKRFGDLDAIPLDALAHLDCGDLLHLAPITSPMEVIARQIFYGDDGSPLPSAADLLAAIEPPKTLPAFDARPSRWPDAATLKKRRAAAKKRRKAANKSKRRNRR